MANTMNFRGILYAIVVTNDQANWKAIAWTIMIGGTLGSVDLVVLGGSIDDAVLVMLITTLISFIVCASYFMLYHSPKKIRALPVLRRRTLIQVAASGCGVFVIGALSRLEAEILDSQVEEAIKTLDSLSSEANPDKLSVARAAVAKANEALGKANALQIRLSSAKDYGARMLSEAAPQLQELTWQGVQLALAQKSFIDSDFEPSLIVVREELDSEFRSPGPVRGSMEWGGNWVRPSDGAALYKIGEPDPNKDKRAVPQYILIKGSVASLDGYIIRNVIFRESHIIYQGGSIVMEGTYFVRCAFDVSLSSEGQRFSHTLLTSVPVQFIAR